MIYPRNIAPRAWLIILMTGLAGMLFFLDRNVLAALKTTLSREMGLSNNDYSMLVTAFMAPYILTYFFIGRAVDRYGTRVGLAVFVGAMSAATFLCGLAQDKWQLAGARVLLGIAEAGLMPATFVAITKWFPSDRRAFAISLRAPIQALGPILAPVMAASVTLALGWRFAFWVPAALGLVFVLVWWRVDTPQTAEEVAQPSTSFWDVFRNRRLWGIYAIRIVTDPFWFLLQFWQAGYLQEALGLDLAAAGRLLWLPPFCESIAGIGLGLLSDRLVRRFGGVRARSAILVGLIVLTPSAFVLAFTKSVPIAVTMLIVAQFMSHSWMTGTTLLAAEVADKGRMASVIGVMSALGGISSIAVNAVAGTLVDWFGYSALFLIGTGVFPVAALIVWRCYLRRPAASNSSE